MVPTGPIPAPCQVFPEGVPLHGRFWPTLPGAPSAIAPDAENGAAMAASGDPSGRADTNRDIQILQPMELNQAAVAGPWLSRQESTTVSRLPAKTKSPNASPPIRLLKALPAVACNQPPSQAPHGADSACATRAPTRTPPPVVTDHDKSRVSPTLTVAPKKARGRLHSRRQSKGGG